MMRYTVYELNGEGKKTLSDARPAVPRGYTAYSMKQSMGWRENAHGTHSPLG